MLADELSAYVDAVRRISSVTLGFHGHNNLGLAVSNTLRAVELGAEYIDTSLQGLGRSAGNAPTEQVVSALLRMGFDLNIELIDLIDVGNEYVRPMITRNGHDPIDTVSGFALFHSSYMGIIREYSEKYAVDPRRLIIALCEVEKAHAPRALVEKLAKKIKLQQKERVEASNFDLDHYVGAEQENEIRPGSQQSNRADTPVATGDDVEPPFERVVRGQG
jgi:isopropylmalate/homocitrate/citramalate synthase